MFGKYSFLSTGSHAPSTATFSLGQLFQINLCRMKFGNMIFQSRLRIDSSQSMHSPCSWSQERPTSLFRGGAPITQRSQTLNEYLPNSDLPRFDNQPSSSSTTQTMQPLIGTASPYFHRQCHTDSERPQPATTSTSLDVLKPIHWRLRLLWKMKIVWTGGSPLDLDRASMGSLLVLGSSRGGFWLRAWE